MKAAITIWENRVSPVFDSARMLLIAEIEDSKVLQKHYEPFNPETSIRLAARLVELDAGVLICGAISELPAKTIESGGVKLIPFIAGNVNEILESYAKGISLAPGFLMPGCGRRRRRQKQCVRRQNNAAYLIDKEVKMMPRGDGTGPQGNGAGTGRGIGGCTKGKGGRGLGQNGAGDQGQTGRGPGRKAGQGKGSARGIGRRKTDK
jgi:predicted Fe-Mo cluster-binding NifX family protein